MTEINRSAAAINARLLSNKRIGQYHQLIIDIGDIANLCKPGNFIAISVGGESSRMILRRAFAISRISRSSTSRCTIEIIVAPHGEGSRWLCSQIEGASLDITAPLGTAFGIPTQPVHALLVGGGYGSAPLFGLAELLKARGSRVDMLLGASTAAKIYAPMEGKRAVNSLRIYTEDGSMGHMGRVSEPIASMITDLEIAVIYSCGPMAMLSAINAITVGTDVVHQCAVEEAMACGVGICMTCVLPVANGAGEISMLRSCIDGPVMDGADVQWDKIGQLL